MADPNVQPLTPTQGRGMPLPQPPTAPSIYPAQVSLNRPTGQPYVPAPAPTAPPVPAPSIYPTQVSLNRPTGQPYVPAPAPTDYGQASRDLGAQAAQAAASGDVAGSYGLGLRSDITGVAHVAASPFVTASRDLGAGSASAADAVGRFAGGLFGTTPAAATPAQVARPVMGPPMPPAAAVVAPAGSAPAAVVDAGPAPQGGMFGYIAPGARQVAAQNPGVAILPPDATPAQRAAYNSTVQSAPAAAAAKPAWDPEAQGLPAGFPQALAARLPRGGPQRIAAVNSYISGIAASNAENQKSAFFGQLQQNLVDAAKPIAGESPATAAARLDVAQKRAQALQGLFLNPNATQVGLSMGLIQPTGP